MVVKECDSCGKIMKIGDWIYTLSIEEQPIYNCEHYDLCLECYKKLKKEMNLK